MENPLGIYNIYMVINGSFMSLSIWDKNWLECPREAVPESQDKVRTSC